MKPSIDKRAKDVLTLTLGGCLMAFGGLIFGTLAGMQAYGMGFPILYEYGALPGYEGMAMFGGMLGACVFSVVHMTTTVRRHSGSAAGFMAFAAALWFFAFVIQDLVATTTRVSALPLAFAPSIILGVAYPWITERR